MAGELAKGTVWLMLAGLVSMGSGYVIHFGLVRMVTPEEYGIFGVILSLLAITEIFLQNGVSQSMSKFVAEGRKINRVKIGGLKTQALFLLIIFPVYFLSAPFIARLLGDPRLTTYIQLSSLLLPIVAFIAVYQGLLDGAREFGKDAKARSLYGLIRVGAVFLFVYLGFSIFGVIYGFIFATTCALIVGWYFVSKVEVRGEKEIAWKEIAHFSLPLVIFALTYTAIMNVDILFVEAFVMGGQQTGYYTSAWTLSKIPFNILLALSFTILPSISKSIGEVNIKQTQSYISYSLRYCCIIIIPLVFLVIATAPKLLAFLFTPEYQVATNSLRILIVGISFLAVYITLSMAIVASGKPIIPMVVGLVLVLIDVILNYLLVPMLGLNGAALATTMTAFIGMVIIAVYVFVKFKILLKSFSFLRILAAAFVIFFLAIWLNLGGFLLIGLYVVLFTVYFGLLYLTKEIDREDIKIIMSIFDRTEQ